MKVCECKIGMTTEKYETRQMKEKLLIKNREQPCTILVVQRLLRHHHVRKISSVPMNKTFEIFIISRAVCELEKQILGECVLDRMQEFDELVRYFTCLNDAVNACRLNDRPSLPRYPFPGKSPPAFPSSVWSRTSPSSCQARVAEAVKAVRTA